MEERGSKEKVIREIRSYQKTILQDLWEEVQALICEATPLFENGIDEERLICTSKGKEKIEEGKQLEYVVVDDKMVKKFKKMLSSIKKKKLEEGLGIVSNFFRTEEEEEGYEQLYDIYCERIEKIENLPTDYNFAETALRFIRM